jgi:hypothetical protein
MDRRFWLAAAPMSALLLAGCKTTYVEQKPVQQPTAQVGVFHVPHKFMPDIRVVQIDDEKKGVAFVHDFYLTPGVHTVGVTVTYPNTSEILTRSFVVKAGGHYTIESDLHRRKGNWTYYIYDDATEQRVDY